MWSRRRPPKNASSRNKENCGRCIMKKTAFVVLSLTLACYLSATTKHTATSTYTNTVQSGTPVRAVDITELRTAANQLRQTAGLAAFTFTDPTLNAGSKIKAVHISELRTAINAARTALAMPAATYTDPTLTSGTTKIKAVHITDLRTAATPPAPTGPTNPSEKNGRYTAMMSPTNGETFWAPQTSMR